MKQLTKPEIRKKSPNRVFFVMEARINPKIGPIVREFKAALQDLYGERLHDVILYGSYARGDFDEESDIDLMVVLNDEEVNTYREIVRLSDLTLDSILKHGMAVSALPTPVKRFLYSFGPVYQNARREGVSI